MQNSLGKISFTADLWSNQKRRNFLAITAHWLARNPTTQAIEYKCGLIAFRSTGERHDGKGLAEIALEMLDRAGISEKV